MWRSINNTDSSRLARLLLLFVLSVTPWFTSIASAQQSGLVRAGAEVELVADGFAFLEGPVRDFEGNLLFTDINNNRIHRLDRTGNISVLLEPSHHANGLTLDVDGSLLICEQSAQRITRLDSGGNTTVVADRYNGQPFNSPNDIWLHRNGSLYFTDPRYSYPEGEPSQPGEYVYRIAADRQSVTAVITDIPKPNGIIGTEDGAHLYISSTALRKVFRYDINPDGSVGNPMEFADQGSDGMTLDERGNVYLTWAGQVSIYSPDGTLVRRIDVPENPANVAFGGENGHTLYITARTGLYSLAMNVVSSRFRYSMLNRR